MACSLTLEVSNEGVLVVAQGGGEVVMESSKFRAPVLHDIMIVGATGMPMFITMLGDKLMHGSGHVCIQRLIDSALARLDDQLEVRVNRVVVGL